MESTPVTPKVELVSFKSLPGICHWVWDQCAEQAKTEEEQRRGLVLPPQCCPCPTCSASFHIQPACCLPSSHAVLDTYVQCPPALGDCTPMSHVPLLKRPLLCAMLGCGQGCGPGSSGSCLLLVFSASLVSEGGSSVFWKVSSFSPPPFCQPSPYLPGPLWGSPDACWEWGSWLSKDQERRFTAAW